MNYAFVVGFLAIATFVGPAPVARAQTGLLSPKEANFVSHQGTEFFVGAGLLAPLLTSRDHGPTRSFRTLDTLATATVLTEGLKLATRVPRPDGSGERNSFPSGHAAGAWALAAMNARYDHRAAPFWFAGAFLISDSRLTLRRHRLGEVLTGAALGVATAAIETRQGRGLLAAPFVSRQGDGDWSLRFGARF